VKEGADLVVGQAFSRRGNFHPGRGESTAPARAVCASCLVRPECLTYALEQGMDDGVWGGTTGKDRRAIKATTRSNERGTSATP
jgi:WhiB family redox-sensing transcriptional regulator